MRTTLEVECTCNGTQRYRGRSELEAYWQPRLSAFASAGFGLEEIHPAPHGVDLEYSVAGALRIRASFCFSPDGKIRTTLCEPARQTRSLAVRRVLVLIKSEPNTRFCFLCVLHANRYHLLESLQSLIGASRAGSAGGGSALGSVVHAQQ